MSQCPRCGLKFADSSLINIQRECPNCGAHVPVPAPSASSSPSVLIQGYFRSVWQILTHPTEFFRKMPVKGGLAGPLAFALITHWLGEALEYLWKSLLRGTMETHIDRLFKIAGDVADVDSPGTSSQIAQMRDHILDWFWGAGAVVLDPFFTLASVLFTSIFVYAGARLLIRPEPVKHPERPEVTFETAVRIVAFGMTPAILAGIPLFGGLISSLCIALVTIIGAREVYRTTNGRATAVALFPKLLILGIILTGLVAAALAIFKLFSTAF